MELNQLEGIGPARTEALRAMGITSLRDLLFMIPSRYEDYTAVSPCNTRNAGMIVVSGIIERPPKFSVYHNLKKVTTSVRDGSGRMPVCWYNQPWMKDQLQEGDSVRLYGRLSIRNNVRTLQNPKIIEPGQSMSPVYRTVRGIPGKTLRKMILSALNYADECCPETLPTSFRMRWQLCSIQYAIRQIHCPDDLYSLEIASRRLSFEQILMYLLYVSISSSRKEPGFSFNVPDASADEFWSGLPFHPTGAQRRVLLEILSDMRKDRSMSRLVQGDVGCGKTAVAFGSIYLAGKAGFQSCMMAPTEILASQHFLNAKELLEPMGIRCRLLTGNTRARERREILGELKEHRCDAVFGTHALISKGVEFAKLGLAVTDEQHRFGVRQRTALQEKGSSDEKKPHVLVMSATPIPRTLALILYGDLDLSVIDELPAGRKAVRTRLVPESKRQDMYGFLRKEIEKGFQAYIVCPLVEDSEENSEVHSVKALFEQLRSQDLKDLRIALTWGSQKPAEKDQMIRDFIEKRYDVLVSTTVIEVGVNNPNATIMIVENAERYGLSQLHQLRGRVGRGSDESWCFLLSDTSEKLGILCSSNDGFVISRKDLELRGPGELIGTRQSGDAGSLLPGADMKLMDEVTRCVQELHRKTAYREELEILEGLSVRYFEEKGKKIALN